MSRRDIRVSRNVSHGGASTNRLRLLDLRTEFTLDARLDSDCLRGGWDTIVTELVGLAQVEHLESFSVFFGALRGRGGGVGSVSASPGRCSEDLGS